MSSVNLYAIIRLLILALSKIAPLFGEVLFKDRSFLEFVTDNKLSTFLFTLLVVLAMSLLTTRYKLYASKIEISSLEMQVKYSHSPIPLDPLPTIPKTFVPVREERDDSPPVNPPHKSARNVIRERLGN